MCSLLTIRKYTVKRFFGAFLLYVGSWRETGKREGGNDMQ